jgi:hypothetical protein
MTRIEDKRLMIRALECAVKHGKIRPYEAVRLGDVYDLPVPSWVAAQAAYFEKVQPAPRKEVVCDLF